MRATCLNKSELTRARAITAEPRVPAQAPEQLSPPDAPRTAPLPRQSGGLMQWIARHKGAVAGAMMGATLLGGALIPPGWIPIGADHRASVCDMQDPRVQRAAVAPFGPEARALAREALANGGTLPADHPYVQYRRAVQERLARLGLIAGSNDVIHISDVDLQHGGSVIRSALGLMPLLRAATSTMSVGDVPLEHAQRMLRPEQLARMMPIYTDRELADQAGRARRAHGAMQAPPGQAGEPTFRDLIDSALVEYEYTILEKLMRLQMLREQRDQISPQARIFVNMSFGTSAERVANQIAQQILTAPPGSELYQLAVRILGEAPVQPPPELFEDGPGPCGGESRGRPLRMNLPEGEMPPEIAKLFRQVAQLKRELIYPQLRAALAAPEVRAIMNQARADLEAEVAAGRRAGILVFSSAGNEHADAQAAGDPSMSAPTTSGVRGIMVIGAVDQRDPFNLRDDQVAIFSGAGQVTVSAAGVRIPVGLEDGEIVDQDGTSFSSPIAVEIAAAAGTHRPAASVEELERLLRDPRVAIDIPGTDRDGAGVLDPFAAVLLARNPQLTRAQIERAWEQLADPAADVPAIQRSLGLS